MKGHDQYSPEQLAALRLTAEQLLQEAAEHALAPPPEHQTDQVSIALDWLPSVTNNCVTFLTTLVRGDRESQVRFEIDLNKLPTTELERLHDVLLRRHAGLDDAVEVVASVTWLLELSIQQTQPQLPIKERQAKVRELLLAGGQSEPTLK